MAGISRAVLTTDEAATYLGVAPSTLRTWRHRRVGPPSFRMGAKVVYRLAALDAYLVECEMADSRSNPDLDPRNAAIRPRRGRSGLRLAEAA
ncbi:helix-turn-helix domain-containing protein [Streptomyces sp. NPDC037389]|uniref:helix-turn-helix domain-containing protein n=1 Tax=Streptomyces sp. NPDC037389 TaxID=3155369 RepID=UPI0034118A57